jgi:DNA end-binding protein Ku
VPRAIWSGSVVFGLVNAPVRLYPAIAEHEIELHLVHREDGSRIGYQKICKEEETPVPDDEVAKGYERNGRIVLLEDEDFEAARGENPRTIEIEAFVPREEIDPIYFERTYYLGPAEGAEKVYALLAVAMEKSGLSAIVRYFFRDREQLACLRVRDGVLLLERMHYADEIRPTKGIGPGKRRKPPKRELDLALGLIDSYRGEFDPSRYRDTYHDRLLEVIARKARGETIEAPEVEEVREPTDLLAALRESVERAQAKNGRRRRRRSAGRGRGERRKTRARGG